MATIEITSTSSFMGMDSWIMANIVQLATFDFCRRFLNSSNDPCGRMFDQMTQAARSCTANIAEGSARHQTSRETEMKLLDVARASMSELAGDYMFILMSRDACAWPQSDDNAKALRSFTLERPEYGKDFSHDAMRHIITQRRRLDRWLMSADIEVAANAMIILCTRIITMLRHQIEKCLRDFTEQGGFTENLTRVRLEHLQEQGARSDNPKCPKCGAVMLEKIVRKGSRQGTRFWGCPNYPQCTGTREL